VEYYDANYADGGEPFATFHFYYRSLGELTTSHLYELLMVTSTESLRDLHIIKRTPEPEAFELLEGDDSGLAQMNREQLEAIIRRFRVSPILLPPPGYQLISGLVPFEGYVIYKRRNFGLHTLDSLSARTKST